MNLYRYHLPESNFCLYGDVRLQMTLNSLPVLLSYHQCHSFRNGRTDDRSGYISAFVAFCREVYIHVSPPECRTVSCFNE
jgi:hypothetical protein